MAHPRTKRIPMELFRIINDTISRLKYFPVNSKGAAMAAALASQIVSDLPTFRALRRLTLEERQKATIRGEFGYFDPGPLVDPREGRSAAPAEPAHASLTADAVSDLYVQPRPTHVRNLSWAHTYYVRCLELAGLVVKTRGELKEANREITRLREHLRLKDLATEEFKTAWTAREHNSAATVRQLKGTIHLLTQGS